MKKWLYAVSAFVLGIVVASSSDAVAAQVKSLTGQKVTGEYTVIVNGEKLLDKGAIISGRTNAPVRAVSESLGADLKVDNQTKVVEISTSDKEALLKEKEKLEGIIDSLQAERDRTQEKFENSKIPGTDRYEAEETWRAALSSLDNFIKLRADQLSEVNEALKAFEN